MTERKPFDAAVRRFLDEQAIATGALPPATSNEERVRVAVKVDEAHLILNESFADAMATLRSGGLEMRSGSAAAAVTRIASVTALPAPTGISARVWRTSPSATSTRIASA